MAASFAPHAQANNGVNPVPDQVIEQTSSEAQTTAPNQSPSKNSDIDVSTSKELNPEIQTNPIGEEEATPQVSDDKEPLLKIVPLITESPSIFSFSEFLASLALMVLAWSLADLRYRFRVAIAPFALRETTFFIIAALGLLTLLTDLWRAEEWLVIKGPLFTPSTWQGLLGGIFLLTFLSWAWFAFIKPPTFGKHNAKRFYDSVYKIIITGSPQELSILATELGRSYSSIVELAKEDPLISPSQNNAEDDQEIKKPLPEDYANQLLLLIADKRLCKMIVKSGSGALISFFSTITALDKYRIPVDIFSKNITEAALNNKDSFLYHESEGYKTGTLGYIKPLSQTLYGDYRTLESIGSLLDLDFINKRDWDAPTWEAYCRITLIAIRGQMEAKVWSHSYSIYRALGHIESMSRDLFKLNGQENLDYYDETNERLRVVTQFIEDGLKMLDGFEVPEWVSKRKRDRKIGGGSTVLDYFAKLMEEVIEGASSVLTPFSTNWWIQYNEVWSSFFPFCRDTGNASDIVLFKLRRRLYDSISAMKDGPNYQGGKILGMCLNTSMLTSRVQKKHRHEYTIYRAVLRWSKKNLARVNASNPRVLAECFPARLKFDEKDLKLTYTFDANAFNTEPKHVYFSVDATEVT